LYSCLYNCFFDVTVQQVRDNRKQPQYGILAHLASALIWLRHTCSNTGYSHVIFIKKKRICITYYSNICNNGWKYPVRGCDVIVQLAYARVSAIFQVTRMCLTKAFSSLFLLLDHCIWVHLGNIFILHFRRHLCIFRTASFYIYQQTFMHI
jgi:hypothetical protein